MTDNRTENLREQYEDALFALLMEEYAEKNGEKLLDEFNRSESAEMPAELDKECRKMIRQHFAQQTNKTRICKVLRFIGRSVATLFITLGLGTALVFSVSAFRAPVINFLLDQRELFLIITRDPDSLGSSQQSKPQDDPTPLAGLVPADYQLIMFHQKDKGTFSVGYKNENEELIVLQTFSGNTNMAFDTEDAEVSSIRIHGYEGNMIKKDGFNIIWYVPETDTVYSFRASNLDLNQVWQIAEAIAKQCQEAGS